MAKGENAGKVTLRHSISLVNFWLTTRCFNTRIVWWSHTLLYPVLGKHNVVAHNCRGLSERGWSWRSDKRGADGRLSGHGRTIEYLGALFGSFAAGAVGLASWHTICGRTSFAEVNEKCAYKNSKMRTDEKKWRHEWRISKALFFHRVRQTIQRNKSLFANDARFSFTVLACLPLSFASCVAWCALGPSPAICVRCTYRFHDFAYS